MKTMSQTSVDAAVLCVLASVTLLHAVSAAGGVVDKGRKPCPIGSYDENQNMKFADVKCVSCEPFCRIGTIEFDLNCRRLCADVFYDIMNPKQVQLPTEVSHPNATKAANGTSNPAAVLAPDRDSTRPTTSMIIFIAVVSSILLVSSIVLVAIATRRRCDHTKAKTVSDNERQGGNPQESIPPEELHLFNIDYDQPSVPGQVLDLHQPSIPESVSVV